MAEESGVCTEWIARQTQAGSGLNRLLVQCKCKFSTAGYTVELRKKPVQGVNQKVCILERLVHSPWRKKAQEETVIDVEYSELTGLNYQSVLVLPDGVEVGVERTDE
jgi:hypothetical protein